MTASALRPSDEPFKVDGLVRGFQQRLDDDWIFYALFNDGRVYGAVVTESEYREHLFSTPARQWSEAVCVPEDAEFNGRYHEASVVL